MRPLLSPRAIAVLSDTAVSTCFGRNLWSLGTMRSSTGALKDSVARFSSATGVDAEDKYYTVGITGASGVVGTALVDELGRRESVNGKPVRVVRLCRGEQAEVKELDDLDDTSLVWNPKASSLKDAVHLDAISEMDAIVHLAGENVATGLGPLGFLGLRPWTPRKKTEIVESRIVSTQLLAEAVAQSPRKQTLLVASGVGAYGDKFVGETIETADESTDTSSSTGFLAHVSREWEAAAEPAKHGRNRVVNMRFGVVMSRKGGALGKLYPIFWLGGGGVVGSGDQYFSFISARDHARAIVHTLETPSLEGPVNLTSPNPCTNLQFTRALGAVLGRPTILPFPSFAVSMLFGEMGEEMLLGGVRAMPKKLVESGFKFLHPSIAEALKSAVEEDI